MPAKYVLQNWISVIFKNSLKNFSYVEISLFSLSVECSKDLKLRVFVSILNEREKKKILFVRNKRDDSDQYRK